ncbi:hypothetical protein N8I84_39075 [Streptomyces cynarae]|uniref:Uncharacterized protein n=1 Tax=Streptomyces cynarae TaxID=2981134 RepID=A0ABY6EBW5_9ACTN|nr:hypothetical protein [Streptomyces cynarae]UXY24045.1 hypothetical protein N8I84_39075 [Streptomyces cynarae]
MDVARVQCGGADPEPDAAGQDHPACDQLFNLHESPQRDFFRTSGTVEELAQRCADWFESLLSRPVVRAEWPPRAGTPATRWEFADTDEALLISGEVPADGSPPDRRIPVRP